MSSYLLWFISDLENDQHYRIKNEDKRLRVYRDYKLPQLRIDHLSTNVLICLFGRLVQAVDLQL